MNIEISARAINQLRDILTALDSAYKEHGTETQNPHYAIYFDTPSTECQDPNEYKSLNRSTLKMAHELKQTLRL